MSPKIGMALGVVLPRSERPLDLVRAAVQLVEGQGLRLGVGRSDHGVGRHKITGGWVLATAHHPRAVSPVGAVCLARQPEEGDHPEDAAAEVLGASPGWVAGICDGWDGAAQVELLAGPARALYLEGLRAGHLLFGELTVECGGCGARRYHRDGVCCRPESRR